MDVYPVCCTHQGKTRFFAWCGNSDDVQDHVWASDGRLHLFASLDDLSRSITCCSDMANAPGCVSRLEPDNVCPFGLDSLTEWLFASGPFPPDTALNFWNLWTDFWDFESEAWRRFRELDETHLYAHGLLCGLTIGEYINVQVALDDLDEQFYEDLREVLLAGLTAFNETMRWHEDINA